MINVQIDMHIRKLTLFALCLFANFAAMSQSREILLLDGWKFYRGAANGAQASSFDDRNWENVTIPHDWAIGGPFDKEIDKQVVAISQNGEQVAQEKTGRTGSLPWIGEGWYRTRITIPAGFSNAELFFDGAMSEPHIWVNGKDVGCWAYGYNCFKFDITDVTDACRSGEYTIAVHLQNIGESSRWYPGAGLYRPVRLYLRQDRYIPTWGIFARTLFASQESAEIAVDTEISADSTCIVLSSLLDSTGEVVASAVGQSSRLKVYNPHLWSPETPYLYTLRSELKDKDIIYDVKETKVGLRQISFSSEGFSLNGQVRKFKGVCLHHDLGPLGAAFNKSAFRRQIKLLKDIGCDAIRTAHNTPCPWQLDICDEMGMMVMAESFDMWMIPKCKNGYSRFFKDWWQKDIFNMVMNARNHPCVVIYSIGNEIPEQSDSIGLEYTVRIQEFINRLDDTRPCTQGMDHGAGAIKSGVWQATQVPGMNYRLYVYEEGLKNASGHFLLATETCSTLSSRGVYHFPVIEEYGISYNDGQMSSYDLEACPWSNLPEDDWMYQDKADWVIGEFVWTGFDYLGEPTPYDHYWPSRSSYFGIYDLAGLPKDRAYLYKTHWRPDVHELHILPHWNWDGREGEITPVYVYTNWPEAELFVNGKSYGRLSRTDITLEEYLDNRYERAMPWGGTVLFPIPDISREKNRIDRYRLRWNNVIYEPGEIKAVAFDTAGNKVDEKVILTAGKPHHIELEADKCLLKATPVDKEGRAADTPDLAFVTVRIVDKDGNLCPNASNQLSFKVSGSSACFNSVCNGDATSLESFKKPVIKAFNGQAVVVVEATGISGAATLSVCGDGLKPALLNLAVE